MSDFAAVETKSFLCIAFLFFWGHFLQEVDQVDIHSGGVFDYSRGGKRLKGLDGPPAMLGNLFRSVPLVLEVNGLGIPLINLVGDGVKGHDLLHEWGGDSGGEETD